MSLLAAASLFALQATTTTPAPDYAKPTNWLCLPGRADLCATPLATVRSRVEAIAMVRTLARALIPAGGVLLILLAARFAYYGYLVPNTYFVKGAGVPFDYKRLAPLWEQGAGRSERMLGIRSKLRRGGGQLVAHSSELPCPHGSSTVTIGPALYDFQTLYRNGRVEMPTMNEPTVEIVFSVVNPSVGR